MGKFVNGDVVINKIFTADKNIILSAAGRLCENKVGNTVNDVVVLVKIISS